MAADAATMLARVTGVDLRYGSRMALDGLDLELPAGCSVGLIGPDGVGKSSLLALLAGVRRLQRGRIEVLGADIAQPRQRAKLRARIAYMPQGLGRNLYPTLSVADNLDFFGRLRGYARGRRTRRVDALLGATGLAPFRDRPVGKLSGGMKQKLGLCCALMHDPDLLVLDEPTTGVDPLSRSQFWQLIDRVRARRPGMSLLVATAYLDEAERFDWVVAMDAGRAIASAPPAQLMSSVGASSLDGAFIALLRQRAAAPAAPAAPAATPRPDRSSAEPPRAAGVAIEAKGLTRRFGDFVAVDHVDLRIARGEIFGFIGSNGCGKTTTMKMLTGLLPASAGSVRVLGHAPDPRDTASRARVGYMTQAFSLYGELTVAQNLALHARLFALPPARRAARIATLVDRFGLGADLDKHPAELPLGVRQRLSLAVATLHQPELLILDEPTSGVDPLARDAFWTLMSAMAHDDGVTLFVSTHLMGEAMRCDRIALMHAGRVLASDTPAAIIRERGAQSLEDAFIRHLETVAAEVAEPAPAPAPPPTDVPGNAATPRPTRFQFRRMVSYLWRESLELRRDPIRLALSLAGSLILMIVIGYGINMDVNDLRFAVLDRDQTPLSRDYVRNLEGSRYFVERPPIRNDADLDRRMRAGEIHLAIEIPPGFARDVGRGRPVAIGAWVDGAMPNRAETIAGYLQGIHNHWLQEQARRGAGASSPAAPVAIAVRYRYNPDVRSLPAMVPAVIPLLLMLIPAILTALSVVREKEMGSIVNLYVTPVTRTEFLLGKQLPYIGVAMVNFALMVALARWLFRVPITGSIPALTVSALLYVASATAMGLVVSAFTRSQVAALFATAVLTILPANQFSGMINPVSSLEGLGRWIGEVYPTTYFIIVCRGTFSKALGFADLRGDIAALAAAVPVLTMLGVALLRKQER